MILVQVNMSARFHLRIGYILAIDLVFIFLLVLEEDELLSGDELGKTTNKVISYSQEGDVGSVVRILDEEIPGAYIGSLIVCWSGC
jgi:hypothetical protein